MSEDSHARFHARFEAEGTLRETTEAVAKARDAVVEAAKRQHAAWHGRAPTLARMASTRPAPDYDDRVTATEEAVRLLLEAERSEAEARARLESLR